jgi:hypothetical protein
MSSGDDQGKPGKRGTTASTEGNWQKLLRARLVPNQAARVVEERADGGVTLAVPTRKPDFLFPPFSWIIRPPKERLAVLDGVGASIWRACDGTQTVEVMVRKFAVKHRLSFHESRVSVTSYLSSLLQRGALAVAVDDPSRMGNQPGSSM